MPDVSHSNDTPDGARETASATRGCAIVTGSARGIGRGIALKLAASGYDIAGCYRTPGEDVTEVENEIKAAGVQALMVQCDVRDRDGVESFVERAEKELGPVTALVNNAAVVKNGPVAFMPGEAWDEVIAVNLTGVWNVCQPVLYRMMRRRSGAVVNISSIVGIHGYVGMSNYVASKAGVNGLSKGLAKEVGPYGVRVNVVAPGLVNTAKVEQHFPGGELEQFLKRSTLGKLATPEDIADMVDFLLSDRAAHITGQVIQVDGGDRM